MVDGISKASSSAIFRIVFRSILPLLVLGSASKPVSSHRQSWCTRSEEERKQYRNAPLPTLQLWGHISISISRELFVQFPTGDSDFGPVLSSFLIYCIWRNQPLNLIRSCASFPPIHSSPETASTVSTIFCSGCREPSLSESLRN
jgi:hypothetical protein